MERGLRQFVQSRVNGGVCGGYLRGVDLPQLFPAFLRVVGFDPADGVEPRENLVIGQMKVPSRSPYSKREIA